MPTGAPPAAVRAAQAAAARAKSALGRWRKRTRQAISLRQREAAADREMDRMFATDIPQLLEKAMAARR